MTGVVEVIFDTEHVSDKFQKRTFVVNDMQDKYPQKISFQCVQDKVSLLDKIGEGQEVEVAFNVRGREWKSPQGELKYFNTLEAWRIDVKEQAPVQQSSADEMPF
jgi:hypothetical protein